MTSSERRGKKNLESLNKCGTTTTSDTANEDNSKETYLDYLYHTKTSSVVQGAINALIENRPEDPIKYLVEYFAMASNPSYSPLQEAYQRLFWVRHSEPAFQRNVLDAYNILNAHRSKKSELQGLTGETFNEFLLKVCDSLPNKFSESAFQKVVTRSNQMISFRRFYRSVLLLLVLKDFINVTEALYKDLDYLRTGKSQKDLCHFVLDSISQCQMNSSEKDQDQDVNMFGFKLLKAITGSCSSGDVINQDVVDSEDFTSDAVRIFLEQYSI